MKKKEKLKQKILKLVEKSNEFIVIYLKDDGNKVDYSDFNLSNAEIITMCEVVKAKTLKKVVK